MQSRRNLLKATALLATAAMVPARGRGSTTGVFPFRLAVISDEISQDFERACEVAAIEFGLRWIELRSLWQQNVTSLPPRRIAEARRILKKYQLRVTDIASPLFKCDWPDGPRPVRPIENDATSSRFGIDDQHRLLERCIELARTFGTNRIRCFDFLRLEDPSRYRAAIDATLRAAARHCAVSNMTLLLENEPSCNTGTAAEAVAVLTAVPERNFMLNWDPGNEAAAGGSPFPQGYDLLPKQRIGHCHCKDVVRKENGQFAWAPVGDGFVDWVGQLQAFQRDGFRSALSLETHWRGAKTEEASTRISMAGLKHTLQRAGIPYTSA